MPLCQNCHDVVHAFYSATPTKARQIVSLSQNVSDIVVEEESEFRTQEGIARWYSFSRLVECELCCMMKAEISQELMEYSQVLISFNGSNKKLKGWARSELAIEFPVRVTNFEEDVFSRDELQTVYEVGDDESSLRDEEETVENETAITTLRDEFKSRVELARTWIETCHMTHPRCNSSAQPYYPTRLIDVKRGKLIDTQNQAGSFQYAALTHCWGLDMPESGMTKTGTLSSHMKSIDEHALPKSFRDSLIITRGLDIPYIWIDSLCIIQDSRQDWENESAHMGLVYSHAWCTIAASSAESCHHGIHLFPQGKASSCDVTLDGGRIQVSISKRPTTWEKFFSANPLNKRGWTFQERELSPRILHFSADQMWWECRSKREQEDPILEDDNITEPAISIRSKAALMQLQSYIFRSEAEYARLTQSRIHKDEENDRIFTGLVANKAVQLRCLDNMLMPSSLIPLTTSAPAMLQDLFVTEARYNTWLRVVQDYSTRIFTNITDRFPALSGLASQMQAMYGGNYVAGMWRDDLLRSLIWRRDRDRNSNDMGVRRPKEYRAPSWSWAAVDQAISYDLVTVNRLQIDPLRPATGHVEDITLVPAGSDPKGCLKSGSLLIRGRVKIYALSNVASSMVFHFDFDSRGKEGEAEEKNLYLLSVFENKFRSRCLALALVMAEDEEEPVFRRVGVVSEVLSEWFEDAMDVTMPII